MKSEAAKHSHLPRQPLLCQLASLDSGVCCMASCNQGNRAQPPCLSGLAGYGDSAKLHEGPLLIRAGFPVPQLPPGRQSTTSRRAEEGNKHGLGSLILQSC